MDAKTFNKELKETLTKLKSERLAEDRHPASETLLAFAEQTLDPEATRHVRMHTFFCQTCRNDLYGLKAAIAEERLTSAQADQLGQDKSMAEAWHEFVEQLKTFALDLGRIYSPGAMLGPIRILSEGPVLSTRGEESTTRTFKVVEVPVGENTYSVELAITKDGSLSFDIAGVNIQGKTPLKVDIHTLSEDGKLLLEAETDVWGNAHFDRSKTNMPDEFVISFTLENEYTDLLCRVS